MDHREHGARGADGRRIDALRHRRNGDPQQTEGIGAFEALLVLGIALLALLCWTLGTAALG